MAGNAERLVVCFVFTVTGCGGGGGGGGGGPVCRTMGGACSAAADCCNPLVCTAGKCQAQAPGCRGAGEVCAANSDCCSLPCTGGKCQAQGPGCRGAGEVCGANSDCCSLPCTGGRCVAAPTCRGSGEGCATVADCCQPLVCQNGACAMAVMKTAFGGPCTNNAQCLSGYCLVYQGEVMGLCSAACAMSTACAGQATGWWCLPNANGPYCAAQCASSAACRALVPTWSCNHTQTVEGTVIGVCAPWAPGELGSPCLDNGQCISRNCNTSWCTAPCVNDAACGRYAYCVFNANQAYTCFPACNVNADCVLYGQTSTCRAVTTRDGRSAKVCAG